MSRRFVLPIAVAVALGATAPQAAASDAAEAAAKGRDCRSAKGVLVKFDKLKAFGVRCKLARRVARGLWNREACHPGLGTGGRKTCTVRRFKCRTRNQKDTARMYGTCVRGTRKIVYSYYV